VDGEPRVIQVTATEYDGAPHWMHPALLLEASDAIVRTQTDAGLVVMRGDGTTYVSPFNTRGHYWPDRWFNVIRLEDPTSPVTSRLNGFYCNIATPAVFDGEAVRYADLQLDVRVFATEDGLRYEVLDEDEFAVARERLAYPASVVLNARRAIDELVALIQAHAFPFDVT
jgi:protein associated with RNAse G/E